MPTQVAGNTELQDEVIDVFSDAAVEDSAPEGPGAPETNEPAAGLTAANGVPDKFKGKSLEDIVASYEHLERAYGQRSNELGDLRRTVDDILKQQLGKVTTTSEEEDPNLLENPKAAIAKALKEDPEFVALKESVIKKDRNERKAQFEKDHPDYLDVVKNPKFVKWITASKVRTDLFQKADATYDYDVATELLTLYKDLHKGDEANAEVARETQMNNLKNAAPAAGGSGAKKRKVYKASDLMKLKDTNPDRYDRMQPEILKAYSEGRVLRDL